MSGSDRARIVSPATLILGGQILSAGVVLVTTPVIALGLGSERYGLYVLLFVFLGYSATLDLGLSYSLVKHVAEHDLRTERLEVDSLLDTASAVYAVIAGLFVLALVLGKKWIATTLLHLPDQLLPIAEESIKILAWSVPFVTAIGVFNAAFSGLLRFDYVTIFSVTNAAVYAIGTAFLVKSGGTLKAVMWWYAGVMAASSIVQFMVLRVLLPGYRLVPRFRRRKLGQLFGFGSPMLVNRLGRLALLQIDRLVIARTLSVSMTAYYAVPFQISQRISMIGGAVATVALPVSSASVARGELRRFRQEYLQSARVLAWLTLAPTLVVIGLADQILDYWMNTEFAVHGSWPLRIMAFGAWWFSMSSLDAASIQGSGRPWVVALLLGIVGIVNIPILIFVTPIAGLVGAASSVTVAVVALAVVQVWYCNRSVMDWPLLVWIRAIGPPALLTTMLSLPVILFLRTTVSGLPSLILASVVGGVFTGVAGYRLFLSSDERKSVIARVMRVIRGTGVDPI